MIVQLLMPVLIGTVFNQGEAAQIFAQRRFRREEPSAVTRLRDNAAAGEYS